MSISTPERRLDQPRVGKQGPPIEMVSRPAPEVAERKRSRWIIWLILVVLGAVGAWGVYASVFAGRSLQSDQALVYFTVQRSDLSLSVVERGTLESQENVQILSEVEEVRGDGIEGTPILWLIKNGSSVKKGDLLVELASGGLQEQLDQQILETERTYAEFIQAEAKYENQKTQNETTAANALLTVDLAELEMEMFTDEESGTHKLEVEEIARLIDDINNEILAAQANLKLKKNEMNGIDTLFQLGYAGKSELDRSRLEYMQAESQYAAKMNKMSTQQATMRKKQIYEKEKQLLTLQGDLDTAKRNLKQVQLDNEALLAQAKAARDAAEQVYKKENERLTRYREQVSKCKIYAPQDGMVVYAVADGRRWWMGEIREGANIRPRQHILSLPDLSKMQVKTAVHESILDEIRASLPASVRIEAFPDRVYKGTVKSVAVMADQQNADTKVYETVVTIDDPVVQLKPGMTAVVEIHIDRLHNVLSVPVQAIVQRGSETWCYVDNGGSLQRREVHLGRTNDKFVEIRQGIEEGERVVLNPMAIIEEAGRHGQPDAVDPIADGDSAEPDQQEPPVPDDVGPPDSPLDQLPGEESIDQQNGSRGEDSFSDRVDQRRDRQSEEYDSDSEFAGQGRGRRPGSQRPDATDGTRRGGDSEEFDSNSELPGQGRGRGPGSQRPNTTNGPRRGGEE